MRGCSDLIGALEVLLEGRRIGYFLPDVHRYPIEGLLPEHYRQPGLAGHKAISLNELPDPVQVMHKVFTCYNNNTININANINKV